VLDAGIHPALLRAWQEEDIRHTTQMARSRLEIWVAGTARVRELNESAWYGGELFTSLVRQGKGRCNIAEGRSQFCQPEAGRHWTG